MSNWEKVKIGDFLKRIKRPIELKAENSYKLVTVRLHHNGVITRAVKKGSDIQSKMYEVKKGDFILSGIDARNGAFGIVPEELDGAIVTNDFWYFEMDENIIDKYFFLELTATDWFDEICKRGSDGTTQRIRLQKDKFFNQSISLPKINDQKRLLNRLVKTKNRISRLKVMSEFIDNNIQLLRQQVYQDAITGKLSKSWKNEKKILYSSTNTKWQELELQAIFKFIDYRGKTPNKLNTGLRLITAKNVKKGYLSYEPQEYVDPNIYSTWMTRGIPKQYDILFTTEAPLGNIALLNSSEKVVFAQRIIILQPIKSDIDTKLMMYFMLSPRFQSNLVQKQTGATAKGIKSSKLKKILIPIPPLDEQKYISSKVNFLLDKIKQLEQINKANKDMYHLLNKLTVSSLFN